MFTQEVKLLFRPTFQLMCTGTQISEEIEPISLHMWACYGMIWTLCQMANCVDAHYFEQSLHLYVPYGDCF